MGDTLLKLIETWELTDNDNYIIAKADEEYIKNYIDSTNRIFRKGKSEFLFNLVPLPWWGNIETPKIIVLTLNPAFYNEKEYDEQKKCKSRLIDNLKNRGAINWLDDEIDDESVSKKWWTNTFKDIMKYGIDATTIYENVGIFELFGYYSKEFPSEYNTLEELLKREFNVLNNEILPTQRALFEHLDYLIKKEDPLVIIIWGQKFWREKVSSLKGRDYIDTIHTMSHKLSKGNLRELDLRRIVETLGGKFNS